VFCEYKLPIPQSDAEMRIISKAWFGVEIRAMEVDIRYGMVHLVLEEMDPSNYVIPSCGCGNPGKHMSLFYIALTRDTEANVSKILKWVRARADKNSDRNKEVRPIVAEIQTQLEDRDDVESV